MIITIFDLVPSSFDGRHKLPVSELNVVIKTEIAKDVPIKTMLIHKLCFLLTNRMTEMSIYSCINGGRMW